MIEAEKRFPTDTMLERIAAALRREPFELFSIAPVQKQWQVSLLAEVAEFITVFSYSPASGVRPGISRFRGLFCMLAGNRLYAAPARTAAALHCSICASRARFVPHRRNYIYAGGIGAVFARIDLFNN
jgi:hypothetical protein